MIPGQVMNYRHRLRRIATGVLATVCVLIPASAAAFSVSPLPTNENFNDFVVGPGKVEVTLNPGESKTVPLTISNRLGETKVFKISSEDFTGSKDPLQTVVLLGDDRGPYTLKDYLIPEQEEFTLENGQKATMYVTVQVPEDAEPGGRYGTVLVSTVTRDTKSEDTGGAQTGASIVSRIGVLFFVTVPGPVAHDGEVVSFDTTEGKRIFQKGPIDFSILFENRGSVHLNPYGILTVTNIAGQVVGEEVIDPWFALPGSLRLREIDWNREFLIGRYTATIMINRGYDDIIDERSVTFWVLPWKIIAIALVVIILFLLGIRWIAKNFSIRRKHDNFNS